MKRYEVYCPSAFCYRLDEKEDGKLVMYSDIGWKNNGPELDYLRDGREVFISDGEDKYHAIWVKYQLEKGGCWSPFFAPFFISDKDVKYIMEIPEMPKEER